MQVVYWGYCQIFTVHFQICICVKPKSVRSGNVFRSLWFVLHADCAVFVGDGCGCGNPAMPFIPCLNLLRTTRFIIQKFHMVLALR